ncbi:hypothetical protein [Streptomyces sp. NPDC059460]|uniref:hypothetical protein n=1 Tax=Streptomyces sp. NPDC059460 TaxID=3346840 RepID=UPI003680D7F9
MPDEPKRPLSALRQGESVQATITSSGDAHRRLQRHRSRPQAGRMPATARRPPRILPSRIADLRQPLRGRWTACHEQRNRHCVPARLLQWAGGRRDWSEVVDGSGQASFGHAPDAFAERVGDIVRLTVDAEQSGSPVIELSVTELRHLLDSAERDLTNFLGLAPDWVSQHLRSTREKPRTFGPGLLTGQRRFVLRH